MNARKRHIAVWEGENYQRTRISRYWNKTVHWLQDFEKVLFEMMTHAELFTSIRMNITERR
jgi:hypothetical protein